MENKIKRRFLLGDEWVYCKIYCGVKTSDYVLELIAGTVVSEATTDEIISEWFFIRYLDTRYHLRCRFKVCNKDKIGELILRLNISVSPLVENGVITDFIFDTYVREVERYGNNTIILAEKIFCADSSLNGNIISYLKKNDTLRWQFALFSIDNFMNDFGYSLKDKHLLICKMKHDFSNEFRVDSFSGKQLGKKYRSSRKLIEDAISGRCFISNILDEVGNRSLKNHYINSEIKKIESEGNLEKELNEYMWSYLHMLNNRLFRSKNRLHELVIYTFLSKYYNSLLLRQGIKTKDLLNDKI